MKLYNKINHMFTGPSPPHHRSKRGLQRQRSPAPFSGGAPLQLCVAAVCAGDSPRPGQVAFCSKLKATSQIAGRTLSGLRARLPKRQPCPALRRRGAKGAPQSHGELGALAPRATCAGSGVNGGRVSFPQDLGAGDGAYALELPP